MKEVGSFFVRKSSMRSVELFCLLWIGYICCGIDHHRALPDRIREFIPIHGRR
jgi:hypothetical protein